MPEPAQPDKSLRTGLLAVELLADPAESEEDTRLAASYGSHQQLSREIPEGYAVAAIYQREQLPRIAAMAADARQATAVVASNPFRHSESTRERLELRSCVAGGDDCPVGPHLAAIECDVDALGTADDAASGRTLIETSDGAPFIGETSPRQFSATGYAGNGMTFGTVAGMMARDAALGRRNPWYELFDTGRTNVLAGA